jgi:hypothetical protein
MAIVAGNSQVLFDSKVVIQANSKRKHFLILHSAPQHEDLLYVEMYIAQKRATCRN